MPRDDLAKTLPDERFASEAPAPEPTRAPLPPPALDSAALGRRLALRGLPPGAEAVDSRYAIAEALGAGSGGQVWAARDATLDRIVAIKAMGRAEGGDGVAAFIAEARLTASLQHPNVLPVYDLDVAVDGRPCFVMKRVEGVSLGEAIRRAEAGEAPPPTADINALTSTMIAVGQALAYAHARGVVHQDVKPDNVMVGRYGEVLLVDWGCALVGQAGPGRLYGTPLYMSPEQARRSHADARSDVYCLGASLFHALLLRPPTPPDDGGEAFWRRKRAGEIDAPTPAEARRAPPELLAIALKAMAAEPGARYADADAMVADLRRFQGGLAVSAYREGLLRVLARWYAHHRAEAWTALIAAALIAMIAGALAREKLLERSDWRLIQYEDWQGHGDAIARRWRCLRRMPSSPIAAFGSAAWGDEMWRRDGTGALIGGTGEVVNLVWAEPTPADLRVEWTYATDQGLNMNCFIGEDRTSGYAVHVGGWNDPSYVALTRGPEVRLIDHCYLPRPIEAGRPYRCRLERAEGRIRFALDGVALFDHAEGDDAGPAPASTFGFDTWAGCNRLGEVRVWRRPLPRRVAPTAVAERLARLGLPAQAEREYRDIAELHAGTDMAREAEVRAAVLALRRGDAAAGIADLDRFAREHPRHALAPTALHEALRAAQDAGDAAAVERRREALAAYVGNPVLRRVVYEIGEERHHELAWLPDRAWDAPWRLPGTLARIDAVLRETERWRMRYGLERMRTAYLWDAGSALRALRRPDLVLECFPPSDEGVAHALIDLGRYEEALARFPSVLPVRRLALQRLARWDELAASEDPRARELAAIGRGDLELARALPATLEAEATLLIWRGRAAEVVGEERFARFRRATAALQLGDVDAALRLGGSYDEIKAYAWLASGQDERLLTLGRDVPHAPFLVALRRAARGDAAGALAIADRLLSLIDRCDAGDRRELMARLFLPALMRALLADDRAALPRVRDEVRLCDGLRAWHMVSLALGEIDEAAFGAQPTRVHLDSDLLLARAFAADLRGERAAARRDYAAWLALPQHERAEDAATRDWAGWRAR